VPGGDDARETCCGWKASSLEAGFVTLFIRQFSVTYGVGQIPLEPKDGLNRGAQPGSLATDGLGFIGPVPKGGVLDPGVQLMQFSKRDIPVKVAS